MAAFRMSVASDTMSLRHEWIPKFLPSENQTSWHYTKGKWLKRAKFNQDIKSSKYQDKFGELAIELTLTN